MFQRGTRNSLVAVIGLGAILATAAAALGQSPNDTWWPGYGNGADNSRYFASRQINKSNVNQLRAAWTYGDTTWTFHTVPRPGEFGYETWPKDAWKYVGGTNNWGELTVDTRRGIAYTPLGSPTYDFYGADRRFRSSRRHQYYGPARLDRVCAAKEIDAHGKKSDRVRAS
jgi:glucose dehydrogenase